MENPGVSGLPHGFGLSGFSASNLTSLGLPALNLLNNEHISYSAMKQNLTMSALLLLLRMSWSRNIKEPLG